MKKSVFLLLLVCFRIATSYAQAAADTQNVIFSTVEIEAGFPGGPSAFSKFLRQNLNSDVPVKNKSPLGMYTVIARFVVNKYGKVSRVVAETNHGYGMEAEVIRVLMLSPDWAPAQQDGIKVNAYRRQPITFAVTKD